MERKLYIQLSTLFFLQFVIWGSWYVTLGTYLLQTAGFDGREVGLVYGATAIAATVSPFIVGVLADRLFPTEKILSVLHLAGGLVMFLVSTFVEFRLFYPGLILYALLYMPTFALTSALIFYHIPDSTRDFPKVRAWGTVGWIAVGLLISYLDLETEATPMYISAGCSLAMALYCLTLPHTPPQAASGTTSFRDFLSPEIRVLFKDRSFTILIISLVLIAIPTGFYYSFVNPFLTEIGVSNPAGKMSIGQISEVFLMLILPFMFRRLKIKWILVIGLFTWGFRYYLFAIGNSTDLFWILYLAIFLHGAAYGFSQLTAQIYVDKVVSPRIRSTAQGFITLITLGFGSLVGAYVAGEVVRWYTLPDGSHDWNAIWMAPTVVGLLVTVFFILFFRPRDRAAGWDEPNARAE